MAASNTSQFIEGLFAGLLATSCAVMVLSVVGGPAGAAQFAPAQLPIAADWLADNFGYSLPVFTLVLVLFVSSLDRLRRMLDDDRPVADVAHAEHLTDTWVSLFFGVGVIWTAIGMRGALIHALGDPHATLEGGAFAVLQKMVDGGILVALSTTIFGGVGGYLLRVMKTVVVGSRLKRCYERAASASAHNIEASLKTIQLQLAEILPSRAEIS